MFVRAYLRNGRIHRAMLSRGGFGGEFPALEEPGPSFQTLALVLLSLGGVCWYDRAQGGVHFSYPGREVLRGVDLRIERGELFGLLGPNGAGKSTLILHLNGVLKPKKGKVLVEGLDPPAEKPREVRRKVGGVVFQDPNDQLFSPTVFEDVAFGPPYNLGLRGEELRERVLWALRAVGMETTPTGRRRS